MIAFVQAFGLHDSGGGSRILSRLAERAPVPVLSVKAGTRPPAPGAAVEEVHLPFYPRPFARVEASRFAGHLAHVERPFGAAFARRLGRLLAERGARAVHVVPHGPEFPHAAAVARRLGLPLVASFHDELDYNMARHPRLGTMKRHLGRVWTDAAARAVISEPMGREYDRRYGARAWAMVTDGLDTVPGAPLARPEGRLTVYFMGLVHLTYRPNFDALVRALGAFAAARPELAVRLVIRGGLPFPLPEARVPVEVRPWGTPAEVGRDMDEADVLYMPLPFDDAHDPFVRYSLSTKMVSYLGSGLPVLYHGPAHAAAAALLGDAAASATGEAPGDVAAALGRAVAERDRIVRAALGLARSRFLIGAQRERFWDPIRAALDSGRPTPA